MNKPVVHLAPRSVVPKDPIPVRRNQQRNRNIGVLLRQIHRFAAIVPNPRLVLSQPIQPLMRPINRKHNLRMKCLLAVHLHRPQRPVAVGRQHLPPHAPAARSRPSRARPRRALRGDVVQRPALPFNHRLQLRRRKCNRLLVRGHLKRRSRPVLLHHHPVRSPIRLGTIKRRIRHVQHILGVHRQPQHPSLLPHFQAIRPLLKAHHRIRRIPLAQRARRR